MKQRLTAMILCILLFISLFPASAHASESLFTGWFYENDAWYYYYEGVPMTGWQQIDGTWYFLDDSGAMQTGWLLDGGSWYYLTPGGAMASGWAHDGYNWYYMNTGGVMQTGWQLINDTWYYMDASGAMANEAWVLSGNYWYYMGADGSMITDAWRKDSIGWCYLGSDGAMMTNAWVTDSVGWCYIGPDGYAVTNCWKQDSVGWCYLNSEGSMTKNQWVLDNDEWYYLDEEGYRVTGVHDIDGITYTFDEDGKMTDENDHTHSPAWTVIQEPTETEDGLEEGVCRNCGMTWTRALPAGKPFISAEEVAAIALETLNGYGAGIIPVEGISNMAFYRAGHLPYHFEHDRLSLNAAATYYKYGEFKDMTVHGLDASQNYYEPHCREAICKVGSGSSAESIGKHLVTALYNSPKHWAYLGSTEYSYGGVGAAMDDDGNWYLCILVSAYNFDES